MFSFVFIFELIASVSLPIKLVLAGPLLLLLLALLFTRSDFLLLGEALDRTGDSLKIDSDFSEIIERMLTEFKVFTIRAYCFSTFLR
jgi:hypothetical protein